MSKLLIEFLALIVPAALIGLPVALAWVLSLKRRLMHEIDVVQAKAALSSGRVSPRQEEMLLLLIQRTKPMDFSTGEMIALIVGEGIAIAIFIYAKEIARLYLFNN